MKEVDVGAVAIKMFFYTALAAQLAFSDTSKDCVRFSREIPAFTEGEGVAIKKYYPSLMAYNPGELVYYYLNKVSKNDSSYVFHFLKLKHLRNHECDRYGVVLADGSLDLVIGTLTNKVSKSK